MTDAAQTTTTAEAPSAGSFSAEEIADVFGPAAVPEAPAPEAKEVPAAAESEPKDKGVSDRIAAAMKAEKRAAELRAKNERKEKELGEREAALKPTAEEIALFQDDPAAFIAKKGWTEKQVASFLDKLAGTYKPEAVAEKKLTTLEQELADVKAKLAAKEQAEEAAKLTAQQRHAESEAGKAFIGHIVSDVQKYPHLTEVYANDAEVVAAGFEVLTQIVGKDAEGKPVTRVQAFMAQHGRGPTDQELAEHLDAVAKAKIEARSKASWRQGSAANQAGQAASGESKVPQAKGTSPRTISRADTSIRAAAPRSAAWSQEQADEESLRILERAMKR
jgi:hypothetical protein